MSDLIIIGYPDEETGERAYEEVQRLQRDMVVDLESAALVVKRPDGKLKVEGPHEGSVWSGTAWGIVFGTLIGLIFLVPLFGLITGGIFGALFGAMDKSGVDESFRERARDLLKPGSSALVMVLAKMTPDKAIEALSQYGGEVLQTSLSHDAEEHLNEALHGVKQPQS
jgi:uncharacterized membrane protein